MRMLYLYNKKNWAIHNVGKLWLQDLDILGLEVTFQNYKYINSVEEFNSFDIIWFGYYFIYKKFNYKPEKSIVAIHDPMELFPEMPDWKSQVVKQEDVNLLKSLPHLITISSEMNSMLSAIGISTSLINTMSLLDIRPSEEINTVKADFQSVFQIYPRKNPELIGELKTFSQSVGLVFDTKLGIDILSEEDYMASFDRHEVYICTSYQEGGPLPAMDAMHRGQCVLTTPVGQIQEIIQNGYNGFICNTDEEFEHKIKLLSEDHQVLHKLRLNALLSIQNYRNRDTIRKSVKAFINNL